MLFLKTFFLDFLLLGLLALKLCEKLGARCIIQVRPALLLLFAGLFIQALHFGLHLHFANRVGMSFRRRTAAWFLPLLNLLGAYCSLGIYVGVAKLIAPRDTWSRLSDLPTPIAIKIGAVVYICLNLNVLLGLPVSFHHFWERRGESITPTQCERGTVLAARTAPMLLLVVLIVLLGVLVRLFPQNMLFYYALSRARGPGNADQALDIYRNFLSRYPDSSLVQNARMGMADILINRSGRPEEGLQLILQVAETESTYSDEARFRAGLTCLVNLGDLEEAENHFNRFLNDYPQNPLCDDACVWMARELFSRGFTERAVAWLDRISRFGDGYFLSSTEKGRWGEAMETARCVEQLGKSLNPLPR